MEVLAAIAYPCIRTEPDYIGRKTAAKAKAGALEDVHKRAAHRLALRRRRDYRLQSEVAQMAASVNKVILIGNLGRDPETRFTNSGSSVTNFSLATKESYQDKSGTRQDRTDWHNIIVWGKQGETCAQYLKKGSAAYVEGRISYREYEAKDGSGKRKVTEIVATRVQFLSSRGAPMADDAGDFGGARSRAPVGAGAGGGDDVAPIDDEDIPF
jgi:single-strand DNA-binding protein